MKLLHIIDDKKFIKFCENTFALDFVENFFLKSGEITLEFLKDIEVDVIFIHCLRDNEIDFFYKNKINTPKIWMFWGADGFSLPFFYNAFLDDDSKIANEKITRRNVTEFLKHRFRRDFVGLWSRSAFVKKKISVMNQMDYIVPIVPGDYELLKRKYFLKPKSYHFNYVVDLVGEVENRGMGNILVGNSASLSNNHFSILAKLSELELGERKVYVPLSYGDKYYREYVLNYISKLNCENIIPLSDFMPYEDYTSIIGSCDVMIMNHLRQQALGNVILGLLNGCTIFMNEKSSLYRYLVSKGLDIRSVDKIDEMCGLNYEEKIVNADLARELFGREKQLRSVEVLLNMYRGAG